MQIFLFFSINPSVIFKHIAIQSGEFDPAVCLTERLVHYTNFTGMYVKAEYYHSLGKNHT